MNVEETRRFQHFLGGLEIVGKPMFSLLAEMVVDVLQASRAVLRVPRMLCTGLEIRSVRAVSVVDQWPFRVRHAEREGSIRLEDAEAFAEQMRDRFRIIQVLEEVLGEDQLAAVGLERQTPAEVEGQVRRWEEVDAQEV